jgi:hypothetical protein
MCYPINGKNHHVAVKDEKKLSENIEVFENYYGKKIKTITPIGGTKSKVDILIIFEDGSKIKISLKSKNSIYSGSFDYVNSSNFGSIRMFFQKTFEIYNRYNNSGNLEAYNILKDQISEDLNTITSEEMTKLFQEHVIDKYDELSLIISDKKHKKIYFDVKPKIFDFVKNGGFLKLKNTGKNTMSYSIIGCDSDGNEYDFNLRIRVHLNNGKTKWVKKGSSVIVFKFQQDSVHKII